MEMEMEMERGGDGNYNYNYYRNWVDDLPDIAISNILGRLSLSVCDLFSFYTVFCSSRSSSSSRSRRRNLVTNSIISSSSSSGVVVPPLLCCIFHSDPDYCKASLMLPVMMRKFYWSFNFTSVTPDTRIFKTLISQTAIAGRCIGYSHGHLIFMTAADRLTFIANIFTGNVIRPPAPPLPQTYSRVNSAILTAPPSSSSSTLVLIVWEKRCNPHPIRKHRRYHRFCQWDDVQIIDAIIYCCLGVDDDDQDQDWSILTLDKDNFGATLAVYSLLVFNGQVFCLLSDSSLLILDLPPLVRKSSSCWKHVKIQTTLPSRNPETKMRIKMQHLVDCGGELLMVHLLSATYNTIKIKIYRLDSTNNLWVEQLKGIGDWCIFINIVGECPPACSNPTVWGGKANCVYLSDNRPPCSWVAHPLENATPTLYFPSTSTPPAVWVYPSMLL